MGVHMRPTRRIGESSCPELPVRTPNGRLRRVSGLIGSGLELHEAEAGRVARMRQVGYRDRAETEPYSAGNDDSDERGQNGACVEIGDEHALYDDRRVTDSTVPEPRRLTIHYNRDVNLELIAGAEALFIDDIACGAWRSSCVDRGLDDDLVFRERFFGRERERKVELPARPGFVGAQAAKIGDHFVHLLRREGVDEGEHDRRETAPWPPSRMVAFQSTLSSGVVWSH